MTASIALIPFPTMCHNSGCSTIWDETEPTRMRMLGLTVESARTDETVTVRTTWECDNCGHTMTELRDLKAFS